MSSRSDHPVRWTSRLVVMLVLGVAGILGEWACVATPEQGFPHANHTRHRLMGCGMCHETGADGESYALPGRDTCLMCHVEGLEPGGSVPPVAAAEVDEALASVATWELPEAYSDVRLPHGRHAAAGISCDSCHGRVHELEQRGVRAFPPMAQCMDCHDRRGVSNDCATCHEVIDEDTAPASHEGRWHERHGDIARMDREACLLCHEESLDCQSCHHIERPASHTAMWRWEAHGLEAFDDREACATCHGADTCSRCHSTTPPANHVVVPNWRWGGHAEDARFDMRGCQVCHSQNVTLCSSCHASPYR